MNMKILVVEDESDVRELFIDLLIAAGYEFEEMIDGTGIVAKAISVDPALILLDLTMPNVDGFEALRLLKSDARTESIPVIVTSAQARTEVMIRVRDLGASDFLVKPWKEGEVEFRIDQILGASLGEQAANNKYQLMMNGHTSQE